MILLLVGCGGFAGSVSRYLLGSFLSRFITSEIPYSTIAINLIGSFIVGILLPLLNSKTHPEYFYLLIPGFLGGFTTFSAFSGEAISLIQKQLYLPALTYVFLTLLGGILLCMLGMSVTKVFQP